MSFRAPSYKDIEAKKLQPGKGRGKIYFRPGSLSNSTDPTLDSTATSTALPGGTTPPVSASSSGQAVEQSDVVPKSNPPPTSTFAEAFSFLKETPHYQPPPAASSNNSISKPNTPSSSSSYSTPPAQPKLIVKRSAGTNAVIVNACQRGNPVLQHIRNVPWEYGDILADYQVGQTSGLLFLSLRYHRLHPEYIYQRFDKLTHAYLLRILLILVDIENHQEAIRELTKLAINNDMTIILAWSQEEVGRYIETLKSFEHKPPDMIKEKVDDDYLSKLTDCLTQIRSVNKTDVVTLTSTFGSLKKIMSASVEEVMLCPGFGEHKARKLLEAFNQPFLVHPRKKPKK
ncbi:uncharacterized protein VTP21DRAFT_760 [Calcarisporiella thermophila]|uniref:uncharacterized protein n=1 Tax=Calcarisporiella thermophila TaxID=911321 RepID=UPI0037436C79